MNKLFFNSSRQAVCSITDIFDFVWPTATAMWNLRWQVDGFLRAQPTASEDTLTSRFAGGSEIRGANLRAACINMTWQQQKEKFAKILLIEICALYEAWLEELSSELALASFDCKGFQFPSNGPRGFSASLSCAQVNISSEMQGCIFPALARNRKYSMQRVENLLKCYRFFKESRNSVIHKGSLCHQALVDAYRDYAPLSRNDLGLPEKPVCTSSHNLGDRISLQLRGVVGFADVVLRLITTLDAELCKCQEAEAVLKNLWIGTHGGVVKLPSEISKKHRKASGLIVNLNLPRPSRPDLLLALLTRNNLVD
jgi:hypothetical protein